MKRNTGHIIGDTITPNDLRQWQRERYTIFASAHGGMMPKELACNATGQWRVLVKGKPVYEGRDARKALVAYDTAGGQ